MTMNVCDRFKEENESVMETVSAFHGTAQAIRARGAVEEPYRSYFRKMASFIGMIGDYREMVAGGLAEKRAA